MIKYLEAHISKPITLDYGIIQSEIEISVEFGTHILCLWDYESSSGLKVMFRISSGRNKDNFVLWRASTFLVNQIYCKSSLFLVKIKLQTACLTISNFIFSKSDRDESMDNVLYLDFNEASESAIIYQLT